mmetsp:Transcript_31756/g.80589  ORF Transcript_31756/g.80589 Transcript_31756/m.80589 type:complete len:124 (-) Transcript_31756:102-473(-)
MFGTTIHWSPTEADARRESFNCLVQGKASNLPEIMQRNLRMGNATLKEHPRVGSTVHLPGAVAQSTSALVTSGPSSPSFNRSVALSRAGSWVALPSGKPGSDGRPRSQSSSSRCASTARGQLV